MPDLVKDVAAKVGDIAGKWTSYAALGTFVLYLFGYLALRFQLSTYGVATNLDIFDEKYLFAGCRFVVFLAMTVPSILLVAAVLWLPLYGIYRLIPRAARWSATDAVRIWFSEAGRLQLSGCLVALIMIQVLLRQCVLLGNMLFRQQKPNYWIASILLAGETAQGLYFAALVLGTGLTFLLLASTLRTPAPSGLKPKLLTGLLAFLVAVEFLLLPVNYGVLISSTSPPRVSEINGDMKLATSATAWLLWDSKDVLTYFICDNQSRTLVTIPRKDNRVSIVGYDPIFQTVFNGSCSSK